MSVITKLAKKGLTMNFFNNCATVEEIKNKYRKLVKQHHPDLGGDTATMQALNEAYEDALKGVNGQKRNREDGTTWTYKYNEADEKAVMEKIFEVLALDMENVEVWMIGTWLWVRGDTETAQR